MEKTIIAGWHIEVSGEEGEYLNIQVDGRPGTVQIKEADEGFVVCIQDDTPVRNIVSETYAHWSEMEKE